MNRLTHPFEEMSGPSAQSAGTSEMPPRRNQDGRPLIGVVRNPRSHRNKGRNSQFSGHPDVIVAEPSGRMDLPRVLGELADKGIDYLVINGGDGTIRDVITKGIPIFGDNWPGIIILPKGKTNALAVDLGSPADWSLKNAMDAIDSGRFIERRPIEISPKADPGTQISGFIFGAGAFTIGIRAGQQAHSWGAFNSFAVGATASWGVLQGFFGGADNRWRKGTGMKLWLGKKRLPMKHSGYGDPDRRWLLLVSTLEHFPLGMKIFGRLGSGLKLAVLDAPRRRILAALPVVLFGWDRAWMPRAGLHRRVAHEFELDLEDQFILDGEEFPGGTYIVREGPLLRFVVP
ncbi:diacylglycerol/lipid kinase family protein [Altererythrobacter aquiaggeris]|uniref:diacylglycerol/lipid kinase family protein n=1 Tax=Aestuarierythrobacter aquiaggeris TaxID=1898396 RepID=UPI003019A46C